MKLSFHGADRGVTGSCHLVECAGRRILVDCGLYQGGRELEEENAQPFGFEAAKIDFVLLTHAHLDHCGRLPLLAKRGFRGEIVTTAPTRELARLVMADGLGFGALPRDARVSGGAGRVVTCRCVSHAVALHRVRGRGGAARSHGGRSPVSAPNPSRLPTPGLLGSTMYSRVLHPKGGTMSRTFANGVSALVLAFGLVLLTGCSHPKPVVAPEIPGGQAAASRGFLRITAPSRRGVRG